MKKALLVSNRTFTDSKTKEDKLALTLYLMPGKYKGGLWYPKKDEAIISVVYDTTKTKQEYDYWVNVPLGSLVEIHYSLNEYSNKVYVSTLTLDKASEYTNDDLYV